MSDFTELATAYIDMWNETDPVARRNRVEQVFAAESRYVDPLGVAVGHDQIDSMVGAVQQQFPGLRFALAGPVDAHHEQARFGWRLGIPGEDSLIDGFDVAELEGSGRLALVLGFLDKVPAA
ncbi:nuclear transport factor 2 family protein [Rhodococcus kronopolitis]|uniref:Nuclear transport factor 2 family protein n=1 Tax=Rhodococcus kronopolitis TaxID=1460226 RepID=A0ABV9FTN6_9NOCA